jgi:hypothetical protein|nr:MAG TPA: immunity protein [Caudoviricetes sp.]
MGYPWEESHGSLWINIGTAENPDWVFLGAIK